MSRLPRQKVTATSFNLIYESPFITHTHTHAMDPRISKTLIRVPCTHIYVCTLHVVIFQDHFAFCIKIHCGFSYSPRPFVHRFLFFFFFGLFFCVFSPILSYAYELKNMPLERCFKSYTAKRLLDHG